MAAKGPDHNLKNKGWKTEDLYFDEEGCLYVANKALADAIRASMAAWKGRLKMYSDPPPPAPAGTVGRGEYPAALLATNAGGAAGVPGTLRTADRPTGGSSEGATEVSMLALPVDATGSGTASSSNPANMMCPCAPEP